jgi:MFS family permease
MYSFDWSGDFRSWLARVRHARTWRRVAPNVWFLGVTSLLTDISSEMVASILPLYLVVTLGMSPFMFGVIDGLYPGVTALVRWFGGIAGDRTKKHKELAAAGYAVSAVSRIAWLLVGASPAGITATVTADRMGKGIRTAPRDAMISLSSTREELGQSFGVHRAMDAAGAMLGPVAAFVLLAVAPQRFDLVFVASFGVGIIGLAVLLLFARNPAEPAARREGATSTGGRLGYLLRQPRVWTAVASSAALAAVTISDAFIYLTLQRQGVVAAGAIPLLYVGTNCAYLLLAVPFGALADRAARWKVFLAGHALMVLIYLLLLVPQLPPPGVVAVLLLLGGYYAATDGVLPALLSAVLPPELRGSGLGLVATAVSLARLVASIAFGWLWSARGGPTAIVVFAVAMPLAMAASAWALRHAEREIIDS